MRQIINYFKCFSGVTLDSTKTNEVWDPEPKHDESDSNQHFGVDQKLIIKMVKFYIVIHCCGH